MRTLLWQLDQVPGELLTLRFEEYTQYLQSRSALTSALAVWDVGDKDRPVQNSGGGDPAARIRRLLLTCPDEIPPPHPEFYFVTDMAVRAAVTEAARTAWTNFQAREWLGATVFAGVALETLLLWSLKERAASDDEKQALDKMHLGDFIKKAESASLLGASGASLARLAQDARNLIPAARAFDSWDVV